MRAFVVAKRLIKQIGGDKRSIALLLIAPVFVLTLLNVILTSGTTAPKVDAVDVPKAIMDILKEEADIKQVDNEKAAIDDIKDKSIDGYVIWKQNGPEIVVEGSDPVIDNLVIGTIKKTLLESTAALGERTSSVNMPTPVIRYFYGSEDMAMFDSMAPLLMGFFIFFFVFIIAGVAFLRERISGTLDRILATPLKRSEIVWGYFIGFGLFIALQTLVIQVFMVYGLNVPNEGSFWAALLIDLVLAAGSLSLGILLSSYARNEFQLFQFIPVVIVPQILFSGIFDIREAPQWVLLLSKIFPLTYGAEALRDVMIRGYGIGQVWKDILILTGYALLFIGLNILALKKYRRA